MHSESTGGRDLEVPPLPDFTKWGRVDRVPRSSLEKRTTQRMITAWALAPHVTHCESADIGKLEAMRRRYTARAGNHEPKLTVTAFLVKAAVVALRDYPKFNASLDVDTEELILKHYYHIGVAVDTDAGLIVPVIRDCDRKTVLEIAGDLENVAQRTRDRKVSLEELRGGTFTITNVGGIGGTSFTPILNYPEVAILGATRARRMCVPVNEGMKDRLELPLCLSFDHRLLNGADAARFAARVAEVLEDPEQLLLGA
jgi:pyruvate dehydrogenase E2 component (dihydrolipoamide acetyltransferase)